MYWAKAKLSPVADGAIVMLFKAVRVLASPGGSVPRDCFRRTPPQPARWRSEKASYPSPHQTSGDRSGGDRLRGGQRWRLSHCRRGYRRLGEIITACQVLWDNDILITPATFPAVPATRNLVRFSITSANTDEELDRAIAALRTVWRTLQEHTATPPAVLAVHA